MLCCADLLSGVGLDIEDGADESDLDNDSDSESGGSDLAEEEEEVDDDQDGDEGDHAASLDDSEGALYRKAPVKSSRSQSKDLLPTEDK